MNLSPLCGWRRLAWGGLIAAPWLFLLYWMASLAVDMPYQDAWELPQFLQRALEGRVTPFDFFAQHNESRIPLLRLMVLIEARLTGWNTHWELAGIALLATAVFWMLTTQAVRAARLAGERVPPWLLVAVSALLFSLMQYECWSFGFTIIAFMNYAATVAGLALLARPCFSWARLGWALLAGAVALYSYSSGILFFGVALLPLWVSLRESRRDWRAPLAVWLGAGAALVAGFFAGYHGHMKMPAPSVYLAHSWELAGYFFELLGGGVANSPYWPDWVPRLVGISGCLLFLVASVAALRRPARQVAVLSFWLALGAYAMLCAMSVAVGRFHLGGVVNALASRYTVISSMFWICALALASVCLQTARAAPAPAIGRRYAGALGMASGAALLVGALLFAVSSAGSLKTWRAHHDELAAMRNELLCDVPDQSILAPMYPSWQLVRSRSEFLARHRLAVFREKKSFADYTPVSVGAGGIVSVWSNAPPAPGFGHHSLGLAGTAFDARARRAARRVIAVDDRGLVVAVAPVRRASDYTNSAWRLTVSAAKFPKAETALRVYAVMGDGRRLAPLGEVQARFPPAAESEARSRVVFEDYPPLFLGCAELFRLAVDQVHASGWARSPDTVQPGEWVILTDDATNIVGYARVGDDRPDVARHLKTPRVVKYGWRTAIHRSQLSPGRHALKAWLFQPDQGKAWKLCNDGEVLIEP